MKQRIHLALAVICILCLSFTTHGQVISSSLPDTIGVGASGTYSVTPLVTGPSSSSSHGQAVLKQLSAKNDVANANQPISGHFEIYKDKPASPENTISYTIQHDANSPSVNLALATKSNLPLRVIVRDSKSNMAFWQPKQISEKYTTQVDISQLEKGTYTLSIMGPGFQLFSIDIN